MISTRIGKKKKQEGSVLFMVKRESWIPVFEQPLPGQLYDEDVIPAEVWHENVALLREGSFAFAHFCLE